MNTQSLLTTAILSAFFATAALANPMIKNSGPDKPLNGQEEWLQKRDFFVPYGTGGLEPGRGYPKPYIPGSTKGLTCGEAEGLVAQLGYRDVKALDCTGSVIRLKGSRIGGQYILHLDAKTGNIVGRRGL